MYQCLKVHILRTANLFTVALHISACSKQVLIVRGVKARQKHGRIFMVVMKANKKIFRNLLESLIILFYRVKALKCNSSLNIYLPYCPILSSEDMCDNRVHNNTYCIILTIFHSNSRLFPLNNK